MNLIVIKWRGLLLHALFPALAFLALGLSVLPDYELFYDEIYETRMARDNIALLSDYVQLKSEPEPYKRINANLEYYGTFFNVLAYGFQNAFSDEKMLLHKERLEIKRYVIFLFSFLGYGALAVAIYWATRSLCSAWLAFGILGLMPLYFTHIFNDPKDIPLAVMMTLSSVVSAKAIMLGTQNSSGFFDRHKIGWFIAAGVTIGLCASIRIAGLGWLLFFCLAWLLCALSHKTFHFKQSLVASLWVIVPAFIVIWVMHPVAYLQPVSWIMDTLQYHLKHPYKTSTLTDGEYLYSWRTPWYFLPKWLYAKVPLLWQGLCVAGVAWALFGFKKKDRITQVLIILFLFQLLCIPLVVILKQSNLYGTGRHFLFLYPAIAFFCAIAIVETSRLAAQYKWPALAIVAFLAAKIAWEMILIHPYQEYYFTEPLRNKLQRNWAYGGAVKEAIAWHNQNVRESRLLINTTLRAASWYANLYSTHKIRVYNTRQLNLLPLPYYVLTTGDYIPRKGEKFAECPIVFSVKRPLGSVEIEITNVRYCQ